MAFRFKMLSSNLLACICFLFSCNGTSQSTLDIQVVRATDYSEDGLDFLLNEDITYIYPDGTPVLIDSMKFYPLTEQDFSMAKDILNNYFGYYLYNLDGYTGKEPFKLRKYFRQYIGYTEKDSLYVYVNLYTHFPTISDSECLCTIGPRSNILISFNNGGQNYGTVIINMNKKKVISFKLSDNDPSYTAGQYSEEELKILFSKE